MPPKAESTDTSKKPQSTAMETGVCGIRAPGPKYRLKTLVGHKEHCPSKHRNPAYSIGLPTYREFRCDGPGPKYLLPREKKPGYSIGGARRFLDPGCSPGPKYLLPSSLNGPSFSVKFRTPYRTDIVTPGAYTAKSTLSGPLFSIGKRTPSQRPDVAPGPYKRYPLEVIKPSAPRFSMGNRKPGRLPSEGPGPKYNPKLPNEAPKYTFGVRYGPCTLPFFDVCDEKC